MRGLPKIAGQSVARIGFCGSHLTSDKNMRLEGGTLFIAPAKQRRGLGVGVWHPWVLSLSCDEAPDLVLALDRHRAQKILCAIPER
jgi:hypothetical protein